MITIRAVQEADAEALPLIEQSAGEAYRAIAELAWIAGDDNRAVELYRELIAAGTCWVAVEDDDQPASTSGWASFARAGRRSTTRIAPIPFSASH
jgi:hypothetical protein